ARAMATVYTAVAAFENSVRELITSTLLDEVGENWWVSCVSKKIRDAAETRREAEEKVRWHAQRGDDPINYTMLPNLLNIIRNNQQHFDPFIHDMEWAAGVIEVIERSRNVIMHSGTLEPRDIARLGTYIRDWTSQVST
ncbi:MAG: Swt1 family HEPN domain-containing protein, partial [Pseudomonadota bacterium]